MTTTEQALAYRDQLISSLSSSTATTTTTTTTPPVEFLMSLYLHPTLTVDEIGRAARAGIRNVKSYPRGVTTNSDSGIESYQLYYHLFRAMEQHDMILNLHGEIPSDPAKVCPHSTGGR